MSDFPTIAEMRALPQAALSADEERMLETVLRKMRENIRESFDGLGAILTVPGDQATSRVMVEACRRIGEPAPDGSAWMVALHFNIVKGESVIAREMPFRLLAYCVIVAVDTLAENVLRERYRTSR